jgi:hypothetical protein
MHAGAVAGDCTAPARGCTAVAGGCTPVAAGGEVPLDVLAVEAFCFVDRGGAFLESSGAHGSRELVRAKTALLQRLDSFFADVQARPTAELHSAADAAAAVAKSKQ